MKIQKIEKEKQSALICWYLALLKEMSYSTKEKTMIPENTLSYPINQKERKLKFLSTTNQYVFPETYQKQGLYLISNNQKCNHKKSFHKLVKHTSIIVDYLK